MFYNSNVVQYLSTAQVARSVPVLLLVPRSLLSTLLWNPDLGSTVSTGHLSFVNI